MTSMRTPSRTRRTASLNAPFGARCFMTSASPSPPSVPTSGLNAPFGARCFMTRLLANNQRTTNTRVLMHLMALGAL
ncbi:hypothetical protein HMPREF0970_00526 [Schaalia odontolytica F0309]|uniref:Uncharacterized protein n=1 Tax=Schaalia odontolytica F0309 TaxID=649742 RepID=D4TX69_9ACTO|nr:hypothetical protein HMPREF0970_00526 [Schaalia odontolytica F0309]